MNDLDLLDLLRRSPEAGMRVLIGQYGGLVYTVVRGRLPAEASADIETCAADTFTEFYLALDRYDPAKGSIRSWLCVIARHNALDILRRQTRTLPLEESLSAVCPSLENGLEEQELRQAVLAEVQALDEPDREILLRKFYLGQPSKEIASQLRLTVSNVDTRTSRAIERLRKKLTEWREHT